MMILVTALLAIALGGCATNQYAGDGCDYRDPLCDSHSGYLASGGHNQG